MRSQRLLAVLAALLFVLTACSDGGGSSQTADTARPEPIADEPESRSILYVQHALLGNTNTSAEEGTQLVLRGTDQTTPWVSDEGSGVLATEGFVDQWESLGLADRPPQAALVPADPLQPTVVLELRNPAWQPDDENRLLTYDVRVVAEPTPRLRGMIGEVAPDLPDSFDVVSLLIAQEEAPDLPEPGLGTTTTTTLPPETTGSTDGATTQPPSSGPATAAPGSSSPPAPSGPPPDDGAPFPPSGTPRFVASPGSLGFSAFGGVETVVLSNVGSGVGSWSATAQQGTGIGITPSSGFLFPGSSVTLQVAYNGRGPNSDFATAIQILTSSGTIVVEVVVG